MGAHDYGDPQRNRVVHASAPHLPLLVESHLCEPETSLPSSWPHSRAEQAPVGQRKPEQPGEMWFLQAGSGGSRELSTLAGGELRHGCKDSGIGPQEPLSIPKPSAALTVWILPSFQATQLRVPYAFVSVGFMAASPASGTVPVNTYCVE